MNVRGLIEGSIRGYHLRNKRGLIPHPTTISRLCIFAGVRGSWDEEETCPKVSPLTLTRVTKGPINLSDILGCISELEKTVNQMGSKQDTLIRFVDLTNDLISTDKVEPTPSEKKRPNMTFSQFSPCLASFDLDPPNTYPKAFIIKGRSEKAQLCFSFPNCTSSSS